MSLLIFHEYCKSGNLLQAKLFYESNPDIDISAMEYAFRVACANGHMDIAKWLLTVTPCINVRAKDDYAFRYACANGNIDVAKWLLTVKLDIDISAQDDCAFRYAYAGGHLELAKWLLIVKPDIDISAENDYAFRWACENGHMDIAKWLLEIKPDINISAYNDFAFNWASKNGHMEVAKWLQPLNPDKYIVIIFNNEIVSYNIIESPIIAKTVQLSRESIADCNICMDIKANILTDCKHQFCETCIQRWMQDNKTCPCCRQKLEINNLARLEE